MALAEVDDVIARAGRIGGYFAVAGNRPNYTDIEGFIAQVSSEVADAIRGYGLDPTALDADSASSLQDLVAYGALARAVSAIGDNSSQVLAVLTQAESVWFAAMGNPNARQPNAVKGSIALGTHPVIRALEDTSGAGGSFAPGAGNFWDDNPAYGRPEQRLEQWFELRGTNLAPSVSKGQHL